MCIEKTAGISAVKASLEIGSPYHWKFNAGFPSSWSSAHAQFTIYLDFRYLTLRWNPICCFLSNVSFRESTLPAVDPMPMQLRLRTSHHTRDVLRKISGNSARSFPETLRHFYPSRKEKFRWIQWLAESQALLKKRNHQYLLYLQASWLKTMSSLDMAWLTLQGAYIQTGTSKCVLVVQCSPRGFVFYHWQQQISIIAIFI